MLTAFSAFRRQNYEQQLAGLLSANHPHLPAHQWHLCANSIDLSEHGLHVAWHQKLTPEQRNDRSKTGAG